MIDERSKNLKLPLPHAANLLDEDLPRLRDAFNILDEVIEGLKAGTYRKEDVERLISEGQLQGPKGDKGEPGVKGDTGGKGDKGDKGDPGNPLQLSDAVNSTSSATGASSKAVKTAYDKAVAAALVGGGFNVRTVLTSGTSYTAPVTGWYKVTVIGAGAGGGAGGAYGKPSNAGDYIAGGGGGGGASGGVAVQYKKFTAGQLISYAIGVAGVTGGGAAQSGAANNGSAGTATTFNGISAMGGNGGYGGSNYTNAGWGGRGGSAVAGGTAGNTGSGGGQSTYSPSVTPGAGGVGGNNGTGYGSGLGGRWGNYAVTHNGWPINGGPVVNGAVILEYNNPAI